MKSPVKKDQAERTQYYKYLAIKVDESARELFTIEKPIKIRIFLLEEEFIFGVN
ncbi:hypothetical protein ACJJI4_17760 [Microbulbifer sp. TRSA002]|uniref:hypothetical protein n=1 Tax=Microbulbifer sp. TRSA002 TaxID=3243382 RepID=UPI004039DE7A